MLDGAFVTEMVSNSFSESNKNLGRLIKQGMFWSKKIETWAAKNMFDRKK